MTRVLLICLLATPALARPKVDTVAVDRIAVSQQLERMDRNLEVLRRMLTLVADRKEQRVLRAQIDEMAADLAYLRETLDKAKRVRLGTVRPPRPIAPPPPVIEDPKPMPDDRFAAVVKSMEDASFSKDKLAIVRGVAPRNHFSTGQVRRLMESMSFGKDQRAVLVTLYPRMVDPDSAHTLLSVMAHASDRRKAQAAMADIDAQSE